MTILRVPVLVGQINEWGRKVATTINQLIAAVEAPVSGVSAALPIYADNTAATTAGAVVGSLYRTSTGQLNVVF